MFDWRRATYGSRDRDPSVQFSCALFSHIRWGGTEKHKWVSGRKVRVKDRKSMHGT